MLTRSKSLGWTRQIDEAFGLNMSVELTRIKMALSEERGTICTLRSLASSISGPRTIEM